MSSKSYDKRELTDIRDRDFIDSYNRILVQLGRSSQFISRRCIIKKVINSAAKSFYVSEREAMRRYSEYKKNGVVHHTRKCCIEKYMIIFGEYEKMLKKYPDYSRTEVMRMVVTSPAPRYFIEERIANEIINRTLR